MTYRSTTLAGLCLAALIAGCGGSSGDSADKASPATKAQQKEHRGGTLTMLWNGAGTSIDTTLDYDSNWQVLTMTSDGLLNYRRVAGAKGSELVPDLAEEIPRPSDDGKNYIFKVRKGIKYSTGAEVKPSDFTYTFERQFKAAAPASNFYQGIVGGDACAKKPKECDLSKGVVADDAASTVTFHLKEPDPDFLQKLAIPFAYVVPKGTPNKDIGTKPLPATGPYMIQEYMPDQRMVFVRNPNFKEWSREAQPDGYPDKIVMKLGLSISDAVTRSRTARPTGATTPRPPTAWARSGTSTRTSSTSTRCRRTTTWRSTPGWRRSTRSRCARRSTSPPTATPCCSCGAARRWARSAARSCRSTSPATSPTARTRRTRARRGRRPTWRRRSSSSTSRAPRARRSC